MRRGRTLIIVGLLLIIVIAGGYLVYTRFLQPGQTPSLTGSDPVTPTPEVLLQSAVRLTQPINRGTVLNETMLDTVSVPQEAFLPGMFTDFGEVVGRKARYDLEAGMLLTSQVLLDTGEALPLGGSDWALVIEPGKVAVSIPISRLSSVSYAPQSGDSVDVIATMIMVDLDTDFQTILPNQVAVVTNPDGAGFVVGTGAGDESTVTVQGVETLTNITAAVASGAGFQGRTELDPALGVPLYIVPSRLDEQQRPRMVSQSVMRNVTVLRVGDFPFEDPEGNLVTTAEAAATPVPEDPAQQQPVEEEVQQPEVRLPDVITLIVDPQDAITLNYLMYSGAELTLALRAAGDENVDPTEAVTLQFLLDEYNIPVPVRLPYGFEPSVLELVAPELQNDLIPDENQNP
jgi:pilus assembly protein CpaB